LVEGARPGDVLVFTFSGHAVQIPDEDGDEDDGLDEAICPADFEQPDKFKGFTHSVVTDDAVKRRFESLASGVNLTLVMDTSHAGSMMDVDEILDAADDANFCVVPGGARPDVVEREPPEDIQPEKELVAKLREFVAPEVDDMKEGVIGFCFAASKEGQLGFELKTQDRRVGVLTHCLLQALESLQYQGSYLQVWERACQIKRREFASLEQDFQLAYHTGSIPDKQAFLGPSAKTVPPKPLTGKNKKSAGGSILDMFKGMCKAAAK